MKQQQTATYDPNTAQHSGARKPREAQHYGTFFIVDASYEPTDDRLPRIVPCVSLRIYTTAQRAYAFLAVSYGNIGVTGTGVASGCGYDKPSAAAQEAIENAGFRLAQRIDGGGETAIAEACMAVAHAIGVTYPALLQVPA